MRHRIGVKGTQDKFGSETSQPPHSHWSLDQSTKPCMLQKCSFIPRKFAHSHSPWATSWGYFKREQVVSSQTQCLNTKPCKENNLSRPKVHIPDLRTTCESRRESQDVATGHAEKGFKEESVRRRNCLVAQKMAFSKLLDFSMLAWLRSWLHYF